MAPRSLTLVTGLSYSVRSQNLSALLGTCCSVNSSKKIVETEGGIVFEISFRSLQLRDNRAVVLHLIGNEQTSGDEGCCGTNRAL